MGIDELGLTNRSRNVLMSNGIFMVDQMDSLDTDVLCGWEQCGPKTANDIVGCYEKKTGRHFKRGSHTEKHFRNPPRKVRFRLPWAFA